MPKVKFDWKRDLTEKIIACASATAKAEYLIKKSLNSKIEWNYVQFKEKVISYADELKRGREPYLHEEFGHFVKSFDEDVCKLRKSEDVLLEDIVKKEYKKPM